MPNPTQSDLHVNVPLTNVSIAYIPNAGDYIADKVFPKVPVQKQSDIYWKYGKSDWRRTDVQKRAPGTESAGASWNLTTDSYYAQVYAIHKDIDDQIRANADSNFNLESDATKFITNQLLLKREIDWAAKFFQDIWGTKYSGIAGNNPNASQFTQWNSASSDPIQDISEWIINFQESVGFKPNTLVLGPHVMKVLKNHPDLIDRIKYTQKGVVTADLVASLLDIPRVLVPMATKTTVAQVNDAAAQDATATYEFITGGKDALLCFSAPSPSLMQPTAGYTFTWNGYMGGNAQGLRVKSFRQEHIASDRIEAEMTFDMKQVAADCGVFIDGAIA
jgi:hypothetical protein